MFRYTICNAPDREVYARQCRAVESNIPGIKKVSELHDVDDSRWTVYAVNGVAVKVFLDQTTGGVFVDSEVDLLPFFKG